MHVEPVLAGQRPPATCAQAQTPRPSGGVRRAPCPAVRSDAEAPQRWGARPPAHPRGLPRVCWGGGAGAVPSSLSPIVIRRRREGSHKEGYDKAGGRGGTVQGRRSYLGATSKVLMMNPESQRLLVPGMRISKAMVPA